MKKRLLAAGLAALITVAASAAASSDGADWKSSAERADKAYWDAYNRADPDAMNSFLADDVEFYHDRGGSLIGKAALSQANEAMRGAEARLRRVAVPGSTHFYPMRRGDEIYGALVTGEHRFYVTPKGKREFLVGRAYFTQLMLLKDGSWKIARIFSYEHVDAEPADRHRQ